MQRMLLKLSLLLVLVPASRHASARTAAKGGRTLHGHKARHRAPRPWAHHRSLPRPDDLLSHTFVANATATDPRPPCQSAHFGSAQTITVVGPFLRLCLLFPEGAQASYCCHADHRPLTATRARLLAFYSRRDALSEVEQQMCSTPFLCRRQKRSGGQRLARPQRQASFDL